MLPVFGTRSNDRASPVTAAPVWAEAGNPSFSSLWLIGSLPPVQDKLPRHCYCHWKEQINVTAGLQEVGHLGDELTVTDNTKPRAPFVSTQQVAVQQWFDLPFTSITPICWRPGGPSTTHRRGLKTCDQSKGVCVWDCEHTNIQIRTPNLWEILTKGQTKNKNLSCSKRFEHPAESALMHGAVRGYKAYNANLKWKQWKWSKQLTIKAYKIRRIMQNWSNKCRQYSITGNMKPEQQWVYSWNR